MKLKEWEDSEQGREEIVIDEMLIVQQGAW
jgi:hypothetical protein